MKVTILGLGEAGSLIAAGLVKQGVSVVAYDPAKIKNPVVELFSSAAEAVSGADVVLSLNSSTVSIRVAESVAGVLGDALYCDLNTGTPALKQRLASIVGESRFVDVAVMKPVPGLAEKVPLAVAGGGASRFVSLFSDLDMNITYVSDVAGEAAARKLVRSILAKGIAAVTIDALWAAEAMGLKDWALEEFSAEYDSMSAKTLHRYLDGTQQHAKRRSVEIADVTEMLSDAGYDSTMIRGVEITLSRVIHGKRIPFAELD